MASPVSLPKLNFAVTFVIEMNLDVRKNATESLLEIFVRMLLGWRTERMLHFPEKNISHVNKILLVSGELLSY